MTIKLNIRPQGIQLLAMLGMSSAILFLAGGNLSSAIFMFFFSTLWLRGYFLNDLSLKISDVYFYILTWKTSMLECQKF